MKELLIKTDYIELQNTLKLLNYTSSGGEAKMFLLENDVYVNGEKENRRGRKLFPNDTLKINKEEYIIKK